MDASLLIPVNLFAKIIIFTKFASMNHKYAVVVLFVLILASSLTSIGSYRMTEQLVMMDMDRALEKTMAEQRRDVITADTIQVFNSYLKLEQLRGKAVLAIDTKQRGFHCYAKCSAATIFSMSDQRPAVLLWLTAMLWGIFCLRNRPKIQPVCLVDNPSSYDNFGGLHFSEAEHRFYDEQGQAVKLTPMQQQLMEMFFHSPTHQLSKAEICEALWPKKEDANETLYTLIKRLKPVIEQHANLRIEAERGKAYRIIKL